VSWRVIVRPNAEVDLSEAARWYESQRQHLGGQFLDEMSRAISSLANSPDRRPEYYLGFRRMQTSRFPYKIFYRIEGSDVVVVRVLHAKRDHRLHLK
jgi:plasmid stabilization system protein ParE